MAETMIPVEKWQWYGNAGHFIGGFWCRFHLCTLVGTYLVSTVGQLLWDEGSREITAQQRGITLKGRGDARLADYMRQIGYDDIGYKRKFETMVFRAGASCDAEDCGCGLPTINGSEIATDAYNDAGSATRGHMVMCFKVATGRLHDAAGDATPPSGRGRRGNG